MMGTAKLVSDVRPTAQHAVPGCPRTVDLAQTAFFDETFANR